MNPCAGARGNHFWGPKASKFVCVNQSRRKRAFVVIKTRDEYIVDLKMGQVDVLVSRLQEKSHVFSMRILASDRVNVSC
jgi:hypothetical protein